MCSLKNPAKTVLITCLFFVATIAAIAQPPEFRAAHSQVLRDHSMQHNMMRGPWNFNMFSPANGNFQYIVTLTDGTEMNVKSKIHFDTSNKKQYLLLVNKKLPKSDSNRTRKIYCNETQNITREDRLSQSDKTIIAFANDSCWLFRELDGYITLFTDLPEGGIVAFRVDNGPIENWSNERMEAVLKDDEKALKKFQRKNYIGAVREYNGNKRR
jgi:hypothetical protein